VCRVDELIGPLCGEDSGLPESLSFWTQRFVGDLEATRRLSPHTVRAYRRELDRFVASEKIDRTQPSNRTLSHRRFQNFLASLAVAGLSNRSIARAAAVLRAFLAFLHREGATPEDLSERVPTVKFAPGLPRFIAEPQMQRWLESLPTGTRWELRDRCLVEFLYATGARVAEIVALDWRDFDATTQLVHLIGKRDKERVVPIGDAATASLTTLENKSPAEATAPDQPLFVNQRGGRLTARSVARILQATFGRTVGGHVTPHRLRHTFATHLLDRGADLMALRELLGHESVATTQVYTHTTPHRLREVYRRAFPDTASR
jgi:integrase/recombinase XerC